MLEKNHWQIRWEKGLPPNDWLWGGSSPSLPPLSKSRGYAPALEAIATPVISILAWNHINVLINCWWINIISRIPRVSSWWGVPSTYTMEIFLGNVAASSLAFNLITGLLIIGCVLKPSEPFIGDNTMQSNFIQRKQLADDVKIPVRKCLYLRYSVLLSNHPLDYTMSTHYTSSINIILPLWSTHTP